MVAALPRWNKAGRSADTHRNVNYIKNSDNNQRWSQNYKSTTKSYNSSWAAYMTHRRFEPARPPPANICRYLRPSRAPLSAAISRPAQEMAEILSAHWLRDLVRGVWIGLMMTSLRALCVCLCVCWQGTLPDQLAENHRNLLPSLSGTSSHTHTMHSKYLSIFNYLLYFIHKESQLGDSKE